MVNEKSTFWEKLHSVREAVIIYGLFLIIAGSAFAGYKGWIPFPTGSFNPLTDPQIAVDMADDSGPVSVFVWLNFSGEAKIYHPTDCDERSGSDNECRYNGLWRFWSPEIGVLRSPGIPDKYFFFGDQICTIGGDRVWCCILSKDKILSAGIADPTRVPAMHCWEANGVPYKIVATRFYAGEVRYSLREIK